MSTVALSGSPRSATSGRFVQETTSACRARPPSRRAAGFTRREMATNRPGGVWKSPSALQELGAGAADVMRTRMYVTNISQWSAFGRAHAEVFAAHPPATTMVEVAALIDPAMLIEVEVNAIRS